MEDKIQTLRTQGYKELKTDSGTGSRILINDNSGHVIKFNQDEAYAKFADFCLLNPSLAVPKIFSHVYPLGDFVPMSNEAYTIAEMELLYVLSPEEQGEVLAWIEAVFATLRSGKSASSHPEDPFDLLDTFAALQSEAQRIGAQLDMLKGTNFLKRKARHERILFSDPFN